MKFIAIMLLLSLSVFAGNYDIDTKSVQIEGADLVSKIEYNYTTSNLKVYLKDGTSVTFNVLRNVFTGFKRSNDPDGYYKQLHYGKTGTRI